MLGRFYRHWLQSFAGINKDIWLLSFVNFINRLGSMVVIFLTIYLTEIKGYSIEQTGYILTANGFGAVIGTYLGGWLTDRFGYYKLQIIALHLQGLVLFILPSYQRCAMDSLDGTDHVYYIRKYPSGQ